MSSSRPRGTPRRSSGGMAAATAGMRTAGRGPAFTGAATACAKASAGAVHPAGAAGCIVVVHGPAGAMADGPAGVGADGPAGAGADGPAGAGADGPECAL